MMKDYRFLLLLLAASEQACGRCDLNGEIRRVQSDQSSVLDCGKLLDSQTNTVLAARSVASCANRAIDEQRPFQLIGRSREASNTLYAFVSRVVSGRYVVYALDHVDSSSSSDRLYAIACASTPRIEVTEFRDGTAQLLWQCSDIDRSIGATSIPYAPPTSVPNGLICPLM
jgi:hypothetical protein